MSDQHSYTPEEEAQITRRIGEAFDFLSDVLADPALLDDIPTGATLRFSQVTIGDTVFHLTAFPNPTAGTRMAQWTARVTSPARWADEGRRRLLSPHETRSMGGKWGSPPTHPESGRTAEEALENLEHKLRDATRMFESDRRRGHYRTA